MFGGNGSFGEIGFGEDGQENASANINVVPGILRVVGALPTILLDRTVRVVPGSIRVLGRVATILAETTLRATPGVIRIVGSTPRMVGTFTNDIPIKAKTPEIGPLLMGTARVGLY